MHTIKLIKKLTILPIETQHNTRRYVALLAGAGLTTASFLVSGGTLSLLGSGIMCGAGLQLSLKSLKEITQNAQNDSWNKSIYDISLGALNGLISSIGLVCAQNQCNTNETNITETQHLVTYYALTGLITGTINGTINEVINLKQSNNHTIGSINTKNNQLSHDDIQLSNIGKTSFMEMGSNMITAVGKSTLFKSATDRNMHNIYAKRVFNSNHNIFKQNIHSKSYQYYEKIKQHLTLQQWNVKQYSGSFSNIRATHKS